MTDLILFTPATRVPRPHPCPFCVCNFSNRVRFERHAKRNHQRRDAYRSRRLVAWLTS